MTDSSPATSDRPGPLPSAAPPGDAGPHLKPGRIFGVLVLLALLVMAWLLWATAELRREARARFFEQYNHQQLILAQQTARTIEEVFDTFRRNLELVVGMFAERQVDAASARDLAGNLERIYAGLRDTPIIDLVVFDSAGTVVAIEPPDAYTLGRNYAWREYFEWARDRGEPGRMYLSPFMRMEGGQHRGAKALIAAEGIYGPRGAFQGVAVFTLSFDELARRHVLALRIGDEGYAWLVDSQGQTVLVDPRGVIGGQSFDEAFAGTWPQLYNLLLATRDGRPGTGWYEFVDPSDATRPVRKLVGYAPVRLPGRLWTLGVCTPQREVEVLLSALLRKQEILTAGAVATILAGTMMLSGLLLRWNRSLGREVAVRTRDLSRARSRLETTFEELLAAKKLAAVGNLALGLAHEIRNPLSSIRMNVQMIRKKVRGSGPLQEHFAIVESEILRLNRLLNDLMGFARPRALRLAAADLGDVVRQVVGLLRSRLESDGVRLDLRLAPDLSPLVCDPEQIHQVVLNLALNALEAMEQSGGRRVLTIGAVNRGGGATLWVGDSGPGIPEDERDKVFDPFFTTKAGGGGLGLPIVQNIVHHHGGQLELTSRIGAGTTVTIQLPGAARDGTPGGGVTKTILVVDDDQSMRRTLELHLKEEQFAVETAADGQVGLHKGLRPEVDLVLLDLRLPKMEGFEVLKRLRRERPALPVVVVTAYDDMQTAIEAIRQGAVDHLGKPLDLEELDAVIRRSLAVAELSDSGFAFGDAPEAEFREHMIVGRSRAMKQVYKAIGAVADSKTTVLLHGESGTGKELVARAIHYNSPFAAAPFVAVACSALAPTVLESELFGHERGAFTGAHASKPGKFELAQGGTLFLDEISEISPDIQVKLLRFLQEREFERVGGVTTIKSDVRVVAASNRDLAALVGDGRFRRDLYYRLRVVTIELPPLRERLEDLPMLVRYFTEKIGRELGKTVDVVPEQTMDLLAAHAWPGNVRELENALRRAILLSPGGVLVPETLQLDDALDAGRLPLLVKSLQDLEREHIENVLRFTGFEKKRTAEILGISRPTLDKRLRTFGITPPSD